MKWNDIYLESVAAELGRKEPTAVAVAEGRYEEAERAANDYVAVRVADDVPAVELAVEATRQLLKRSAVDPADIVLIVHSSIGHQGMEHFAPASYVQGQTVGGEAAALEVKQFSNGGLAALQMAAAYLAASGPRAAALMTTSDKFVPPTYDRYRSDRGIVFGDGGTAAMLTRGSGVAQLLSTVVISDGTYGAVYIGNEEWSEIGGADGRAVDLRARREQFLANNAALLMQVVRSTTDRQRQSVERALADAELTAADVDRWVFLNVGRTQVDVTFRRTFGVSEQNTSWQWGREVGHLGAGDQIAGLANLVETGAVRTGDVVALCSMGMGFSYGCALVRITAEPNWSITTD